MKRLVPHSYYIGVYKLPQQTETKMCSTLVITHTYAKPDRNVLLMFSFTSVVLHRENNCLKSPQCTKNSGNHLVKYIAKSVITDCSCGQETYSFWGTYDEFYKREHRHCSQVDFTICTSSNDDRPPATNAEVLYPKPAGDYIASARSSKPTTHPRHIKAKSSYRPRRHSQHHRGRP
jgi:hypothetical protein